MSNDLFGQPKKNKEDLGIWVSENGHDFYKEDSSKTIWQVEPVEDTLGEHLFSFDKKTIFNFFQDYPEKLTKEQVEIFKKEYPDLAKLKSTK